MVAQGVEDELDLTAGGGDDADVAAAAGGHLFADPADHAGLRQDLDGLDGGPADQPGALFGDPAAVYVGVGLVVFGGQPGTWTGNWIIRSPASSWASATWRSTGLIQTGSPDVR